LKTSAAPGLAATLLDAAIPGRKWGPPRASADRASTSAHKHRESRQGADDFGQDPAAFSAEDEDVLRIELAESRLAVASDLGNALTIG